MARRSSWNPGMGEELKIGRYTVRIKRSIGEGGFAFIHLVEICNTIYDGEMQDVYSGRVLVLKRSSLQSLQGRQVYEREASIMQTLAHPNIVQFLTAVELPSYRMGAILMEYCTRGHLLEALNKRERQRLSEPEVLPIITDVVSGIKYLHDKGLTHRDIKLDNILRSLSGSHKLCDFGSCVQGRVPLETPQQRANEEEVVEKTTTQMYRAPEMVDLYMERELTEKVDIWALGCVLYAICYLKNPFQDAGNLGILNARIRVPEDSGFSSGLVELIRRLLTASPTQRPSASEVESGVHALSRGDPLPRPRIPKASETQRPRESPKSAVSGAAPTPGAAGSHASLVDGRRRDSGGAERGRKGSLSPMAKGRGSTQGTPPRRTTPPRRSMPGAASKAKEPQLNPNSVAARRLASRKGVLVPVGVEGDGVSSPQQAMAGCVTHRNEVAHGADQDRRGLISSGAHGTETTGGSNPTRRAAVVPEGDAPHGGPSKWNDFASFDQFSATELAWGRGDDGVEPSFDTPDPGKAFGSPSANQGAGGSPGRDLSADSRVGGGKAAPLDKSHSSPLVELDSHELIGHGGDDVAALGQRLAGAFPSSSANRQAYGHPRAAVGWNTLGGKLEQPVWPNGVYGEGGQMATADQAFPFAPGQQSAAGMMPSQAPKAGFGLGASASSSLHGAFAGMSDVQRSISSPSSKSAAAKASQPEMGSSSNNRTSSEAAGGGSGALVFDGTARHPVGHSSATTFPAPPRVRESLQSRAPFNAGGSRPSQSGFGRGSSLSTQWSQHERHHQEHVDSNSSTGWVLNWSASPMKDAGGGLRSKAPGASVTPYGTARVHSSAVGKQRQQQQDVFGGSS